MDELGTGTDPSLWRSYSPGDFGTTSLAQEIFRNCDYPLLPDSRVGPDRGGGVCKQVWPTMPIALKPLYRFVQGKPGSSFALELMRKTGFDMDWISRINELAGKDLGKTEDLMLEWEQKNQQLEQTLFENRQKLAHLTAMLEEYGRLKNKISEKRKLAMDQAKKEAELLLAEANKRIEQTIRIIQENKADKTKRQKLATN